MANPSHRRFKKSLERSFDDLLQGLEDESLPDLDDMITDEIEDISLSTPVPPQPENALRIIQLEDSNQVDPSIRVLQSTLMDDDSDAENLNKNENINNQATSSSEGDSSEEDSPTNQNDFDEQDAELGYQDELLVHESESMAEIKGGAQSNASSSSEEENMELVDGDINNSGRDQDYGSGENNLDFSVTEDADQLNVDHSKHKTSLMRRDSTQPYQHHNSQEDSTEDDEPSPAATPPRKPHGGSGVALPGLHQGLIASKLKPTANMAGERKRTDQSSFENSVNLRPISNEAQNSVEKQDVSHTYEKPALRNVGKKTVPSNIEKEHVFDKPTLRNVERPSLKIEVEKEHIFDKPALRRVDPVKKDNERDQIGTETGFDKPALRKTEFHHTKTNGMSGFEKPVLRNVSQERTAIKPDNNTENDKPIWLTELKLKKTGSRENVSDLKLGVKEAEKPSWLHSATKKRTKIAEFMRTKENQADDNEEINQNASALESLHRTPRSHPLTENGENVRNTQITAEATARRRLDSAGREDDIFTDNFQPKAGRDNYVPSWLKATPKVPSSAVNFTTNTSDIPQWKQELANRRKARIGQDEQDGQTPPDTPKSDSKIPPWKLELSQRKKRPVVQQVPSCPSSKNEPEWKRLADERRARLANMALPGQHSSK
ncbi:hypothetical protein ScPMuIL_006927 [Solemya velum]